MGVKLYPQDRVKILDIATDGVRSTAALNAIAPEAFADAVVAAAKKYEEFATADKNPRISETDLLRIQEDYGSFRSSVLSGQIEVNEDAANLMNHLDKLLGI